MFVNITYKTLSRLIVLVFCLNAAFAYGAARDADERPIALAVHGGAGTMKPEEMTPEKRAEYHAALRAALQAGYAVLEDGGAGRRAANR